MAINQLKITKQPLAANDPNDPVEFQLDINSGKTFESILMITVYLVSDNGKTNDKFVLTRCQPDPNKPAHLHLEAANGNTTEMLPDVFPQSNLLQMTLTGNLNSGKYRLIGSMLVKRIRVPLIEAEVTVP